MEQDFKIQNFIIKLITEIEKINHYHSITIEKINFNTVLSYNINTNHIRISTKFNYQNPNKNKSYHKANKEKLNVISRTYRESHRNPDTPRKGSLEFSIMLSCIHQGINRNDFVGFLTDQKYCKLFSETFKEIIRNRFHNKCYLCDKNEKNNGRKLSVHHVNYNKACLCQKTCEFVPLCQSCHAKTNFIRQYYEDLIMCYLFPNRYFMVEF